MSLSIPYYHRPGPYITKPPSPLSHNSQECYFMDPRLLSSMIYVNITYDEQYEKPYLIEIKDDITEYLLTRNNDCEPLRLTSSYGLLAKALMNNELDNFVFYHYCIEPVNKNLPRFYSLLQRHLYHPHTIKWMLKRA
jgi:hypothetical protein